MYDLDLKIDIDENDCYPLIKNMIYDSEEFYSLTEYFTVEKLSFLNRRLVGALPGEKIYFIKNCGGSCFDFQYPFFSNIYGGEIITPDSKEILSGVWSFSVYFSFLNNRLFKISLQYLGDPQPTEYFTKNFFNQMCNKYGKNTHDLHTDRLCWEWRKRQNSVLLSCGKNFNFINIIQTIKN